MPLYHIFLGKFKKAVRIPEYGYIGLTEKELKVIDTFEFQRLRWIRQAPGAYMVYPGMSHTRFEHSLGVMHLAGEAATHVILNSGIVSNRNEIEETVQLTRLAALLHDIGHGPFSHTFELAHQLAGSEWKHEEAGRQIIRTKLNDALNQYGFAPDDIIKLLDNKSGKPWYPFMRDIVISPVYNVDRMNYLVLDSARSGALEYGIIDAARIIQNMYSLPNDWSLTIGIKAKDATLRMLEAYVHMYRSVYLHKKATAADTQIAYALKLAWDNGVLDDLKNPKTENLLDMNDYTLLDRLVNCGVKEAANFIERYRRRDILKVAADISLDQLTQAGYEPSILIKEIRNDLSLEEHQVIYDILNMKRPAPYPSEPTSWQHFMFYDDERPERTGKLEEWEVSYLVSLLKQTFRVRIYTFKENEKRVKEAVLRKLNLG